MATRLYSPTAAVVFCWSGERTEAIGSSLKVDWKLTKNTTTRIGRARRMIRPKKIRKWPAPSIRADSSMSTGMVSK